MREEGFSLLELMIYMAIVGILVMAAVPQYKASVAMANTTKIQMDLSSLNTAIALYHAQNGTVPKNVATDLADYVQNAGSLHPPKGESFLKTGSTISITDEEYGISKDGLEATCQSHVLCDFGRKENKT